MTPHHLRNPPDEPDIALHMPYLERIAAESPFIIELGCGDGHGSMRAFRRGHHGRVDWVNNFLVSVDLRPGRLKYFEPHHGTALIIQGDSADPKIAAMVWSKATGPADLIFIDTEHTYEHISKELQVWEPLSGPGTVWLFHDTWMFGEYNRMTDAIKEFAGSRGLVYEDLSVRCNGLGRMAAVASGERW
jgi:cephalosporin hydroxylase